MVRQLDENSTRKKRRKKVRKRERKKARKKRTYAGIPATTSSSLIKACSYCFLTFRKIFIVALASWTCYQF